MVLPPREALNCRCPHETLWLVEPESPGEVLSSCEPELSPVWEGDETGNRAPYLDVFLAQGARGNDHRRLTTVRRVTLDGVDDVIPKSVPGARTLVGRVDLLRTSGRRGWWWKDEGDPPCRGEDRGDERDADEGVHSWTPSLIVNVLPFFHPCGLQFLLYSIANLR